MFKSIQPLAEVLNLEQTSIISGGGSFCTGFGLASGVFAAGVWLNWWNPVGWTAISYKYEDNKAKLIKFYE